MSDFKFLEKHAGVKVLVDIENAGLQPGSMMFTIGAVVFDLSIYNPDRPEDMILDKFYIHLDRESQEIPGIHIDKGTLKWWSGQSLEAKAEIHAMPEYIKQPQFKLKEGLERLLGFIPDEAMVFARGQDFEYNHLSQACRIFGMRWCRNFNRMNDVRTFVNGFTGGDTGYVELPSNYPKLVPHHALHDCIRDAFELQYAIIKYHTE